MTFITDWNRSNQEHQQLTHPNSKLTEPQPHSLQNVLYQSRSRTQSKFKTYYQDSQRLSNCIEAQLWIESDASPIGWNARPRLNLEWDQAHLNAQLGSIVLQIGKQLVLSARRSIRESKRKLHRSRRSSMVTTPVMSLHRASHDSKKCVLKHLMA